MYNMVFILTAQDHWTILTSKIGIAEGFFNAHFQYLLQLFVFFVEADRHPSSFQYAAAFGSLLFLESLVGGAPVLSKASS